MQISDSYQLVDSEMIWRHSGQDSEIRLSIRVDNCPEALEQGTEEARNKNMASPPRGVYRAQDCNGDARP